MCHDNRTRRSSYRAGRQTGKTLSDMLRDGRHQVPACDLGVEAGLQVDPRIGRRPEVKREPGSRVASDSAPPADNGVDAAGRHVDRPRQLVLADPRWRMCDTQIGTSAALMQRWCQGVGDRRRSSTVPRQASSRTTQPITVVARVRDSRRRSARLTPCRGITPSRRSRRGPGGLNQARPACQSLWGIGNRRCNCRCR